MDADLDALLKSNDPVTGRTAWLQHCLPCSTVEADSVLGRTVQLLAANAGACTTSRRMSIVIAIQR